MRIGIDYTAAVRQRAGIGRYTRNLIQAVSSRDRRNAYVLLVAGAGVARHALVDPRAGNVDVRWVPISDRWLHIIWQRLRVPVPVQAVTGRLDLFHSPDFVLPPVGKTPSIVTVHDLSFLRVPQHFVPGFSQYLSAAVTRAVRRADRLLADSESTRSDLVELLGVAQDKIRVIYPGVERRFEPIRDLEVLDKVQRRYGLPDSFILGLGTLQPRKNFTGLIKAFELMIGTARTRQEVRDVHLVIAGGPGWLHGDAHELVMRLGLSERVHFAGFVEDEDLPGLYSLARAFAFPSWYEGFGLPILEAMACGTPVLAADNSSLPEVVGEAGLLVEAGDVDALAAGLLQLLVDEGVRESYILAGRERAAQFTWERAAEQLLVEYDLTGRTGQ